jgi:hypothetical protein
MRLSGAWFKLADERGVYIGLLMVPEVVSDAFEKKHETSVRCVRHPQMPMWLDNPGAMNNLVAFTPFVVELSWRIEARDMLTLWLITPEEISAEPGFAFLPSAEYLRQPVVEKVVEQKPTPSGKFLAAAREVAG